MKILVKYGNDGVSYHRLLSPIVILERLNLLSKNNIEIEAGVDVDWTTFESFIQTTKDLEYDTVFFSRVLHLSVKNNSVFSDIDKFISYFNSKGIKLICDVDDHWSLPKHHSAYKLYRDAVEKILIKSVRASDCVITTTDILQNKLLVYNKNTFVIPNIIAPSDQFTTEKEFDKNDTVFGSIAGASHLKDIYQLRKTLPTDVNYMIGGYDTRSKDYWKKIESVFTFNYTKEGSKELLITDEDFISKEYTRLTTRTPFEYGKMYRYCNVSLVPLEDNEFNSCKSPLKLVEAGMTGTAAIVSNVEPYKKYLKNGKNCLVVKNNIDWGKCITSINENKTLRDDLIEGLRETISEEFNFIKWSLYRVSLFKCVADIVK